jgi:hypothetical protein
MIPFEYFFSWLNVFVPVNEAVTASSDAVKDLTASSLFAMISLLSKYEYFLIQLGFLLS